MKLYITVNPHGGKKKGKYILSTILPLLKAADIELNIIETAYSGHACDLATQLDFVGYDGMVAIGGDGTLHEITNGLMRRSDNIRPPIGIIPAGSGNSFMHDLKMTDIIKATKSIISGKTKKIDVAEVKVNHVKKYAINIIGWGLVTQIGKNAEYIRWLGPSRYTVMSIIECFRYKPKAATLVLENNKIIDDFTFIIACNTIHTGKGMKMAPKAKLNDGLIDLVVVRGGISTKKLLLTLPKVFHGTHIQDPLVEYYQVKEFGLYPKNNEVLNIDGELIGSTPIHVKMIPSVIDFFSE